MFRDMNEMELKNINAVNDVFSSAVGTESRININKALAVLIFKRLTFENKINSEMDKLKRWSVFTNVVDELREMINIDGEIFKKALIENDNLIFNSTWEDIYNGGPLYPEYPSAYLNHKPTFINFILNVSLTPEVRDYE